MARATIPEGLRAGRSPSYLVLLQVGFGMRARSLARRWALTPPFHPYPFGRCIFCATFRGSLRAAVSGHPALWSPDFPLPYPGSDRPTHSGGGDSSIAEVLKRGIRAPRRAHDPVDLRVAQDDAKKICHESDRDAE